MIIYSERLFKFLTCEEVDLDIVTFEPVVPQTGKIIERVSIINGHFSWLNEEDEPFVKNINLSVKDKCLLSIVGT